MEEKVALSIIQRISSLEKDVKRLQAIEIPLSISSGGGGGSYAPVPHELFSLTYHTGDVIYTQVDSIVNTAGVGVASMLNTATHVHTGADGSTQVTYANLLGIPATFVPIAHDLLSAYHGDTVVNAPTRGSLIYGNLTPKWDELVLGGVAGSVLTRDATDVMWSAAAVPTGSGTINYLAKWTAATVLGDSLFKDDGTSAALGTTTALTGYTKFRVGDAFTSDGSSNTAWMQHYLGALTGAAGDTSKLMGSVFANTIVTQAAAETVTLMAQVYILEPGITKNVTDITTAATLYVDGAPTEATSNYAICVSSGASYFGGNIEVPAASGLTYSGMARGDVLRGNAGGTAFERLTLGGVAGSALIRDATDVLWSAAAVPTGTGTDTHIAWWSGASTLSGEAAFTYDDANDLMTITGASATRAILQSADAATVTATFPLRLDHITSAAAGVGFGVGAEAYLKDDSGADQLAGSIAWRWSVAATATRRARIEFRANYAAINVLVGVIETSSSTAIDGNARGQGAVDLQTYRNAATCVASALYSTLVGGYNNTASSAQSVCVGGNSNIASGANSAVLGGSINTAQGSHSFAGGIRAATGANDGVFVWADSTALTTAATFTATVANQFAIRTNGGAWFAATDLAAVPGIFSLLTLEGRITGAGVGAANDGVGILFKFETGTDLTYRNLGAVQAAWSVAAAATSRARLQLRADYTGTNVLVGVIEAPANASTDGNARGIGAIEFGGYRTAVTQVASGDYAVMLGGYSGTASGDHCSLLGGRACTTSGDFSVASGSEGTATRQGQVAHGNKDTTLDASYQRSDYLVAVNVATHVDTTWYSLFSDGTAEQLLIAANTLWTFSALLQGATAGMAQRWCYKIEGAVVNDGGTTSILAQTVTTIYESDAAYDCQVVADDGTDALVFQVRRNGGSDYDVWWTATIVDIEETRA